jgi:hypothetical protein
VGAVYDHFPKSEAVIVSDNEMFRHLDTGHIPGSSSPPRKQNMLFALLDFSVWMIVDKDDCYGRLQDIGFEGIPGGERSSVQAAAGTNIILDDFALRPKRHLSEHFLFRVFFPGQS